MAESFAAKLQLTLKILSLSRGGLAAELGVDQSVISRWVTGASQPTAQNLALLTGLIARRIPGFTVLDWDRDSKSLAERMGADPVVSPAPGGAFSTFGLPLDVMEMVRSGTTMRAAAYEGFFRSTRPYAINANYFIHDHGMIRRDASGLLRLNFVTAGVYVESTLLPVLNQLYCIGAERATGSPVFGIFQGAGGLRVNVLDGLTLTSVLDAGRTPTASPILVERIGDLTGDVEADDATFAAMADINPLEPADRIPQDVRDHLMRDTGPAAALSGGDSLTRSPLARSWAH